jgi:predicted nucleic acid-binding Zn ribbon protein
MKCNCKGCPERTQMCHSTCESYLEYTAERQRVRQNRINDSIYMGYITKQSDKASRIHFARNK